MSPVHIAPHGAIRIILIIQMIFSIFIKHTVGVVHPTIDRSVMIERTEHFSVGIIKRIGKFQFFPAGICHGIAYIGTAVAGMNVESYRLTFILLQSKRNKIVDTVDSQPNLKTLIGLIIHQYIDSSLGSSLFHRQQKVFLRFLYLYQTVVCTQIMDFQPGILCPTNTDTHYYNKKSYNNLSQKRRKYSMKVMLHFQNQVLNLMFTL